MNRRRGAITVRQALVLFLFVVLAFTLVTVRTEVNTHRIDYNRRHQEYVSCLRGQVILVQFDRFVTRMAAVEMRGTLPSSPTYDKAATPTRLERARNYLDARIHIDGCGQEP